MHVRHATLALTEEGGRDQEHNRTKLLCRQRPAGDGSHEEEGGAEDDDDEDHKTVCILAPAPSQRSFRPSLVKRLCFFLFLFCGFEPFECLLVKARYHLSNTRMSCAMYIEPGLFLQVF